MPIADKEQKKANREKAALKQKLWVRLTKTCNNNCLFCLDREAQNGEKLSLKSIEKKLREGRKRGISQVVLSGGEATIHPDFIKIIGAARKMGYEHVQVITNGRMFAYSEFLARAVKAGLIEITFSIHSHREDLHDKLVGVSRAYRQAISGLKNALETPNLIVSQDIVINRQNVKELADTIEFFLALGVHEFDLLQIIPFGTAWDNRRELFYDIKRAMPHIRRGLEYSKRPDVYLWLNRFPPEYLDGFEELIQHPNKLKDEIEGRRDMFENFRLSGKMMECQGARCQYCYLKDFCADLIEFRAKGRLDAKSDPVCLKRGKKTAGHISKRLSRGADISDFLNFFIKHRFFLKSPECAGCSENSKCDGAWVGLIREKGFRILKPKSFRRLKR